MLKTWLWSIFGNDEDWPPPADLVEKHPWQVAIFGEKITWLFFRNPLHNLTWHRWGFHGEPALLEPVGATDWYPKVKITRVKTGQEYWYYSFQWSWWEGYSGVRPSSLAWGIKFRPVGDWYKIWR